MDIAALATAMGTVQLQQDISAALMSQSLDLIENTGEGIQKILESSVAPYLGQNIDISL